ncbi:NUDIX domain-containing protein [candidate division CSSED10-310 bacterium]|uniref:NUDIX domain-containing protein n=1 Tax=candidate division CSSED10-310 bacterium TaxID=2855610 RepID=A0ABV6YXP7_UNCC1
MCLFKNIAELQEWLAAQKIDTAAWGVGAAKSVSELWQEIMVGETTILNEPPVRVVRGVVQVMIRNGSKILIEREQEFAHNQKRYRNTPPAEKMKPAESYTATVLRCMSEEFGIKPETIEIREETYRQRREMKESSSYPGLLTLYHFHIVEVQVQGLPDTEFWTQETGSGNLVTRHHWIWKSESETDGDF